MSDEFMDERDKYIHPSHTDLESVAFNRTLRFLGHDGLLLVIRPGTPYHDHIGDGPSDHRYAVGEDALVLLKTIPKREGGKGPNKPRKTRTKKVAAKVAPSVRPGKF